MFLFMMMILIKKSRIIFDQAKPAHKDGKFWCFDLLQHSQFRGKLTIPTRMTCNADKDEGKAIARFSSGDWDFRIRKGKVLLKLNPVRDYVEKKALNLNVVKDHVFHYMLYDAQI